MEGEGGRFKCEQQRAKCKHVFVWIPMGVAEEVKKY